MTEPQTPKPAPALVKPSAGSRLETLAAAYRDAKQANDDTAARLVEIKDAIKIEMANAAPNAEDITLWTPVLDKPLRLHQVAGAWRVDTKRMKKEAPALYVEWAVQGSPTWKLDAA